MSNQRLVPSRVVGEFTDSANEVMELGSPWMYRVPTGASISAEVIRQILYRRDAPHAEVVRKLPQFKRAPIECALESPHSITTHKSSVGGLVTSEVVVATAGLDTWMSMTYSSVEGVYNRGMVRFHTPGLADDAVVDVVCNRPRMSDQMSQFGFESRTNVGPENPLYVPLSAMVAVGGVISAVLGK